MSLFANDSFLGVDIGSSAIKVVQLRKGRTSPSLVTYGMVEAKGEFLQKNLSESTERIKELLKQVLDESKVSTNCVSAALPGLAVFTSLIELPRTKNAKKLDQIIRWEAKQYVPIPVSDVILSWNEVDLNSEGGFTREEKAREEILSIENANNNEDSNKKPSEKITLFLTAAPKDLVERFRGLFKSVGLNLSSLEVISSALVRSLATKEDMNSSLMIVDIGATDMEISVVSRESLVLNRTVGLGSLDVTKVIARGLGIEEERADAFKKDFGIRKEGLSGQIFRVTSVVLNQMLEEINTTRNSFEKKYHEVIDKVVLAGGGAKMRGLDEYLSQELGVRVIVGNPWQKIGFPKALEGELKTTAPEFASCVGLAMRNII